MKAADLFVKCLENEGVEYVFGLPGEEIAELLRALDESRKIKFVLCAQEQAASFMADVYGRLKGKAGVCLSTLGPGATNLLTGVADAYLDRAPLVAITGQGGLERTYEESHQYIDIISVYKFVTKWNRTVTRPSFIPQVVRKAFSVAEEEKAGAVHIELPEDVAGEPVQEETKSEFHLLARSRSGKELGTTSVEGVRKTIELVRNAKYPLILAGNGVTRSSGSEYLTEFSRLSGIPVVTTFMGKGVISAREETSLGTIGLQTRDLVNCAFERADLVLCIGYDFVEYSPKFWNKTKSKLQIIHIDTTNAEVDRHYFPSLELVGDICLTLRLLIEEAKKKEKEARRLFATEKGALFTKVLRTKINAQLFDYSYDNSFPVKPQRLIYEIRKALRDSDILISDVGMHKTWIGRLYPAYAPNTVIMSNGFASMGIALPGSIAAKLAKPEHRVLAACGDGGFLMTVYNLATAKALGVGITVVVFNDGKYSQIEWKQLSKFKRSHYVDFENPNISALAESFGCRGIRIQKTSELAGSLQSALDLTSSNETCVIDVPVDSGENQELTKRLGKNVKCPK